MKCEYALAVKWSDVVYKCDKKEECKYELKNSGAKYCTKKEKE